MTVAVAEREPGGYTVREAARLLGINPRTLKRYITAGQVPTYWIGKSEMVAQKTIAEIQSGQRDLLTPRGKPTRLRGADGKFTERG